MSQDSEKQDVDGEGDVAMELAFSQYNSPTVEGFTDRLEALEKARPFLLEEDQYAEWREAIFTDLASPKSFSSSFGVILYPLMAVALVLAVAGYLFEIQPLFFGGGGLSVVVLLSIAVLAIVNSRNRSLSHSERLQIVDQLLASSTITQEEARLLRSRIRDSYGEQPAA